MDLTDQQWTIIEPSRWVRSRPRRMNAPQIFYLSERS
jgi:hypothetical protein